MSNTLKEFVDLVKHSDYHEIQAYLMDESGWKDSSDLDAVAVSALKWNMRAHLGVGNELRTFLGNGPETCPLCHKHRANLCDLCPVSVHTNQPECAGLPLIADETRTAEILDHILEYMTS
jgi:hypothetical protein